VSNNIEGTIKGRPGRGLVTIRKDGSILLENVTIKGVRFKDCDIIAESGEYPIPFADRMNRFEDYLAQFEIANEPFEVEGFPGTFKAGDEFEPNYPLWVGGLKLGLEVFKSEERP
jgi:hypothetical protein